MSNFNIDPAAVQVNATAADVGTKSKEAIMAKDGTLCPARHTDCDGEIYFKGECPQCDEDTRLGLAATNSRIYELNEQIEALTQVRNNKIVQGIIKYELHDYPAFMRQYNKWEKELKK